ncbi:MAG: GDSL-type esterase/lipase family protein [Chloroflexota bacterium]
MTTFAVPETSQAPIHSRAGVWLSRSLLLLLSVAIPLVGLEVAFRTFGPFLPGNYPAALYLEPHPVYGFFHVPNSIGWLKTDEYTVRVEINSRGLRERELAYDKPANVRRVLVLGDSFVEGAQVVTEHLLTRRLEALLTERTGLPHEVINAGVAAWGTDQEYLFLQREALRYQPDLLVVLFYSGNDVTNNSNKIKRTAGQPRKPYFELTATGELRPQAFVPRAPREDDVDEQLRRSSLVYALLHGPAIQGMKALQPPSQSDVRGDESPEGQLVRHELPIFAEQSNARWNEAWKVTEALLIAMRRIADAHDTPLLLVNAPTKWEIYPADWDEIRQRNGLPMSGWNLNTPGRRLAEIAERGGIEYLDLRPRLQHAASGPRLYYSHDIHWTAHGHATAAHAIAETLLAQRKAAR